jgi:CDGSH-type Zn-finger protein
MSEKVKITVKPNGSIRVEGDFELNYTKQGESEVTTEVVEASSKSLCRCGHSKEKPFCDGAHRDAGFQG